MKFSDKIHETVNAYKLLITKVFQGSCYQISEDIAMGSPVSTGKLLGQWSPNKNSASNYSFSGGRSAWHGGIKDESIADANRSAALDNLLPRIESETDSLSNNDVYYFTNDTPYVKNAEFDEGFSREGAYHMRTNAIQNWQSIVNREAKKVAK